MQVMTIKLTNETVSISLMIRWFQTLCEVTTAHFIMALKYARVVLKSSNPVGESDIARLLSITTTT